MELHNSRVRLARGCCFLRTDLSIAPAGTSPGCRKTSQALEKVPGTWIREHEVAMRVHTVILCCLCLVLVLSGPTVGAASGPTFALRQAVGIGDLAQGRNGPPGVAADGHAVAFVPGEVVIRWQPDPLARAQVRAGQLDVDRTSPAWHAAAARLAAATDLPVLDLAPEYGMARLAVPVGEEAATIARLAALPWITHAGLNHIAGAAGYPNDPHIGDQWHMRRIAAPAAWDLTFGSYSLVVAVLDTGVDLAHPEFAGRLLSGWDYVNWDAMPNDDNGHGTHVAGIIAAAADNGVGVAGLAANVKLLPLKVLNAAGQGNYYDIAIALYRAADNGAQVINLSLGGFDDDNMLREAVNYALGKQALVVAAAGNCAQGGAGCPLLPNPMYYPAAYPGVFAVAASDRFDNWANYSGYKSYVALAAPGGVSTDPVLSTWPGGYGWRFGTSMATAQVSAAAALVLTFQPTATPVQVADILKQTADQVGPYTYVGGRNDWFGAGRLNVGRAVRWAYPPSLRSSANVWRFLLGGPLTQTTATLAIRNDSEQPVTWQAAELAGASWLRLTAGRGETSYSRPDTLTLEVGPTTLGPGQYDAVVQVAALTPPVSGFYVFVTLKVADSVQQLFLPAIAREHQAAAWIDPGNGGVTIFPTDESPYRVELPFPVPFYGQEQTAVSISFKGYVSFTQPGSGASVSQSSCLPTAALPNDAIYVLWQDWKPNLGGQVFVHQPDNDHFVVTWMDVRRFAGDLPHSFQLILARDGALTLQYRAVQTPVQGTIGIENWDGTVTTQLACNGVGTLPRSGDAFALAARLPW